MGSVPVAKINVKLLEFTKVKTYGDFVVKDIYSSIFKNPNLFTTDIEEYQKSLLSSTGQEEKEQSNNKSPNIPRYFTPAILNTFGPSVTVIGNAIIATPVTPNFDMFPARLATSSVQHYDTIVSSASEGPNYTNDSMGGSSYRVSGREGNSLGNQADSNGEIPGTTGTAGSSGGANGNNQKEQNTTLSDNSWIDQDGLFEEKTDGVFSSKKDVTDKFIESNFKLKVNQPFAFKFKFFKLTPEQDAIIISKKTNEINKVLESSVDIYFGDGEWKLSYYSSGSVGLKYKNKPVGSLQRLPTSESTKDAGRKLIVYPLGNSIYVYGEDITTEATKNGRFVEFNLREPIIIKESTIKLVLHSGECHFNFSPVVHPNSGIVVSPLIGGGFEPDRQIAIIAHVGKFGVGSREFPITFPDSNDKNRVYEYLKDYCKIDFEFTEAGSNSNIYSYTLTLGVRNDTGMWDDLDTAVNEALQKIGKQAASEFIRTKNGQQTKETAASNMLNITQTELQNSLNLGHQIDQTWGRFGGFLSLDSKAEVLVNGVKENMESMVRSLFGGDFSGYFSQDATTSLNWGGALDSQLKKASKNVKSAVSRGKVKFIGANIYSAAVFLTQIIFKKDLETVGLNPNPQIDNCDVMEVTVNQAVEQNRATVVLNNRDACSTSKRGIYTYAEGTNNFCGIKPIQIQLGYQEDVSEQAKITNAFKQNIPLQTVFTGYINKRRYIRSKGNTSQCVLECEDMSKKFKEQFAVNLPFFDGWCHIGAMYYLAREAGFDDDEILLYQDPVTGRKARLRDYIIGDPDTFRGGCFDGHVDEDPVGAFGLDGGYLHATLPLVMLGSGENANYNFSVGTPLWSCMQRIREFLNWYMYCNNFGNLVYGPPQLIVTDSGVTFKEVDKVGELNEIQSRLEVDYDTAYTRNMVFLQGQKFVPDGSKDGGGNWVPHVHIKRKPNFPNDISETSYAPWIRYAFVRNPKIESAARANYATAEYFRRYTRLMATADYSAWGHPSIFPYHYITIDESILNETGANDKKFIVAAHTVKTSSSDFQLKSDFSVETFDPASFNYEPNVIHLRE